MLIDDYDLELFTPPCEPGAETWSAIARLKVDISEVLPYLNATLRGAVYNHAAKALTWKKGGRNIAFHPYKIAAANLEDRAEAERVIKGLVKTVNRTWQKRAELEPDFEMRQRPTPIALFKLLPGTNCKQCGQPTCFTFALKLAAGQQRLEDCPPLLEPAYADRLAQLRAMVIDAPAIARTERSKPNDPKDCQANYAAPNAGLGRRPGSLAGSLSPGRRRSRDDPASEYCHPGGQCQPGFDCSRDRGRSF